MNTYTWAQFKAAVKVNMTDRTPSDTIFTAAALDYVKARIALQQGDKDGYQLLERRYMAARKALIGYNTTANTATLRAAVKALLRDTDAGDTMFAEAVAHFVRLQGGVGDLGLARTSYAALRWKLSGYHYAGGTPALRAAVRSIISDSARDETMFSEAVSHFVRAQAGIGDVQVARASYAALRFKLLGYTWVSSDAALKAAVRLLTADVPRTDKLFAEAVANYIRAQIGGNQTAGGAYYGLKFKLAGYNWSGSDAALQESVRVLLSDGPRTNAEFARTIALFVRAEFAREVESRSIEGVGQAMTVYQQCRQDYERARLRMAGFNHSLGGGLSAEVVKFLPNDVCRTNTATLRTALIASAVEDIQSYGTWMNEQIATAKSDLQTYETWFDRQITTAREDLQEFGTWANATITTAQADIEGLDDWLNEIIAHAEEDIQSLQARVDVEIRNAVLDLQEFIRAYTVGHTDIIVSADTENEGYSSKGYFDSFNGGSIRSASILRNRNAQEDNEVTQDQVTPTVNTDTELVAEEERVFSVTVVGDPSNVSPVLMAYDAAPTLPGPLVLPVQLGVVYDLNKVRVQTQTVGDKVNYLAVLAPEFDETCEEPCDVIPWAERRKPMVLEQSCDARISISPRGDEFLVQPILEADVIALRVEWDGRKLDFDDADMTPFDEDASKAAALYATANLIMEWGEAVAQQQMHWVEYRRLRTRLFLKHRQRGEIFR